MSRFTQTQGEIMKNLEAQSTYLSDVSIGESLVGVWALKSYTNIDSQALSVEPFGPSPVGLLIYTADGFVSAQLMDPERRSSHEGDWGVWTPAEYEVFGRGYIAYCGRYEVDEMQSTVTHVPSVAFSPNLVEQRLLRRVELIDNRLDLTASYTGSNGEPALSRLEWIRMSSESERMPPARPW
jgi:Lipocalin-like domain